MSVLKPCSLAFAAWMVSAGAFAADGEWTVRKSSGEVWTGAQGVQPVSLGQESVLKPGDTVTTGRNGRVLLVRGQETILIAPNSVVGVPAEKKDGLATTITQQAGSILLEVEKRNVPHFEVETPYLAAVVKGTQFRVSVTATGTRVDVQRGQVEVVDFKSGQIAQVLPGQAAQSFAQGAPGLSLTGSGAFRPIEHGAPRAPTLELIKVPKSGITAPTLERGRPSQAATLRGPSHSSTPGKPAGNSASTAHGAHRHGAVRISAPLGEVRLNVQKATQGLARSASATHNAGRRTAKETTIWNVQDGKSATGASAIAAGDSNGNAASASGAGASVAGSASGAASVSGISAATAAVAAGSSGNGNSTGNGGGNSGGNGKGNGNGNGNGNGGGNGNGNGNGGGNGNGNGNGNAGNGNGNGNGHGRGKS
jgi:hypothetical protein